MRGDCSASTCVLNMCYGMGVSVVTKERYYNDPLLAHSKHVMCYRMGVSMVVKERYYIKVVAMRLNAYCEWRKIFLEAQYGF